MEAEDQEAYARAAGGDLAGGYGPKPDEGEPTPRDAPEPERPSIVVGTRLRPATAVQFQEPFYAGAPR